MLLRLMREPIKYSGRINEIEFKGENRIIFADTKDFLNEMMQNNND